MKTLNDYIYRMSKPELLAQLREDIRVRDTQPEGSTSWNIINEHARKLHKRISEVINEDFANRLVLEFSSPGTYPEVVR